MSTPLQFIALESGKQPDYCIIWLHGLGADGHDFVPLVDELNLPFPVRYIFPHAPKQPVTINGGFVMRAWYDIVSSTIDAKQDAAGIQASQISVESLIKQQIDSGIPAHHIFLAGFSQGGAIALHLALRSEAVLAGVLALSTYLPLADHAMGQTTQIGTPIFMAHGRADPVVPYPLGVASYDKLVELGCTVTWHEYMMQHSVCAEEIADIGQWISTKMTA